MKEIPLTRGYVALVDDEDYDRINALKWYACVRKDGMVYARRKLRSEPIISMQHMVFGERIRIDHADGNGLNNQRGNLRPATNSQNAANHRKIAGTTSKYRGVTLYPANGKWVAQLHLHKKHIHLGYFKEEVDAATVYNLAAYEAWGEFARLNTPEMGL